ncbi:MAG: UvrD-helicase domain-containing protein [Candidatus Omnitrophica bacterium]|nr:UvrD-helicase domain-containing protein [Candidatus Omnitrophota bacterium]MDD5430323.1 UvrD-helicase domain-containing protein [Candidatus Omnitrophota bacterium]
MNQNEDYADLLSPQVVVVEASAGSGKTYALAKRYLKLLINPALSPDDIPLRSILAITFTNKATVEMKERILELLKRISLEAYKDNQQQEDLLRELGVDKALARDKASRIIKEFIHHYSFFQVQTIDSFINFLLLGSALNIGRSSNFKIQRDYNRQLSYCLDLAIEEAVASKEVFDFLEEFLEHYLFVENRNGWFPKEDILTFMHSLFQLSNKYGRTLRTFKGSGSDVIKLKKHIHSLLSKLSGKIPEGFNSSAKKSILSFLEKSRDIFDISSLPAVLQKETPLMNKGKVSTQEFNLAWEKIRLSLLELIELDAVVAYNPYIKLFGRLSLFFQEISRKEDVLFLEELNRRARALFDEDGLSVAELYYQFSTRFKHYLIDEFQDTSVLQWRNLQAMVEDALACGGTLFYVGDKKQAIYRFRGGEARLFDEVKNRLSNFNVTLRRLDQNWRSKKAIVDFNNQVFSQENLSSFISACGISSELGEDPDFDKQVGSIFGGAHQKVRPGYEGGYVYLEKIKEKNQGERNEIIFPKIIDLLKDLRSRGFGYEDIAILVRDNSDVELLSSLLLGEGIPVESEKTLNVTENLLIKNIVSFLSFLHSPIDNLSFAGFILGDIFSAASGISNREASDFIFSVRSEGPFSSDRSLYRIFRQRYPEIWDRYFDEFFKSVGFVSAYELVTGIYQRFEVFKNFSGQQAFFMKFLELIKVKEDDYSGLGDFLEYLKDALSDDLYVNASHSASVRILTVHKAKGLEFPVVILPLLRMEINPETAGKGTSSYVVEEGKDSIGLVRITKMHRKYSSRLNNIYTDAYKKACIDELNNMYVALTRAQHEMYIYIPARSASANNKAAWLMPEGVSEKGQRASFCKPVEASPQKYFPASQPEYKNWLTALRDEFGSIQEIVNRERILEGNNIHNVLSRVINCAKADAAGMINEGLKLAAAKSFSFDIEKYRIKAEQVIANPGLKDIFYVNQGQVFCEKEVINRFGELKRIDRLIVKDKEAWVIDYKSSYGDIENYRGQIREYIDIIGDIFPGKRVRGFLLFLDDMNIQEVK